MRNSFIARNPAVLWFLLALAIFTLAVTLLSEALVLKEMKDRRGGDRSGRQQQQLAIARALIPRPRVLLLDEPAEGIQPNIIRQIGRVIATLRDEAEIAVLLVEQYFDFAVGPADEFVALNRGSVVLREPKARIIREVLLERVPI